MQKTLCSIAIHYQEADTWEIQVKPLQDCKVWLELIECCVSAQSDMLSSEVLFSGFESSNSIFSPSLLL